MTRGSASHGSPRRATERLGMPRGQAAAADKAAPKISLVLRVHKAVLSLEVGSEKAAAAIWEALSPESRVALRNVRVELALSGSRLDVVIEAGEESALRATLNSFIRLIHLSLEVIRTGESLE